MRTEVVGIPLDEVTPQTFTQQVKRWIEGSRCATVTTPNPEFVVRAQHDEDFRAALLSSDLSIPDGVGTVAAARLLHGARLRRLTGVTATKLICQLARAEGWGVALCGGRLGVAPAAAARLCELYPGLKAVAVKHVPVVDGRSIGSSDEVTITELETLGTKILLVAFGAPKQELWLYRNRRRLSEAGVRLAIGVGGTFDYLAGAAAPPPRLLSQLGFEWLWRLLRQPQRLPRIWRAVVVFSWYVLRWRRQLRRPLRSGVTSVVVNQRGDVLLLRSTFGGREGWVLPGGGVEPGESTEQAAIREAAEEAGLSSLTVERVAQQPYCYRWPLTWHRSGYGGKSTTVVTLRHLGPLDQVQPSAAEGFVGYRWVQPSELNETLSPIHRPLGELVLTELHS